MFKTIMLLPYLLIFIKIIKPSFSHHLWHFYIIFYFHFLAIDTIFVSSRIQQLISLYGHSS